MRFGWTVFPTDLWPGASASRIRLPVQVPASLSIKGRIRLPLPAAGESPRRLNERSLNWTSVLLS